MVEFLYLLIPWIPSQVSNILTTSCELKYLTESERKGRTGQLEIGADWADGAQRASGADWKIWEIGADWVDWGGQGGIQDWAEYWTGRNTRRGGILDEAD